MIKPKAIIADDEIINQKSLLLLIEEYCPELEVSACFSNIEDAVFYLKKNPVEIVFLDITFGNSKNAFDYVLNLNQESLNVVFVTAHQQYAVKAFEFGAVHYLLKPVSPIGLRNAVARILSKTPPILEDLSIANRFISIAVKNEIKFIPLTQIEYVKANGSYTDFHLISGEIYTHSKNLKNFEQFTSKLSTFLRIHKSYIVSKSCITSVSKTLEAQVTLTSGKQLPISLSYRNLLDSMRNGV